MWFDIIKVVLLGLDIVLSLVFEILSGWFEFIDWISDSSFFLFRGVKNIY